MIDVATTSDSETVEQRGGPAPGSSLEEKDRAERRRRRSKLLIGPVGLVISVAVIGTVFQALSIYGDDIPGLLQGVIAVIAGVGGAALVFYFINMIVEGLPARSSERSIPYAFLLPALLLIGVMLIYPTVQTIHYSFANADSDAYVGLQNYIDVFNDPDFRESIFNNILWLIIVPAARWPSVSWSRCSRTSSPRAASRSRRASSSCPWRSRSWARPRSGA